MKTIATSILCLSSVATAFIPMIPGGGRVARPLASARVGITTAASTVASGDYFVFSNDEEISSVLPELDYQTSIPDDHPFAWARLLGVVHSVKDMKDSEKFYREVLQMTELRTRNSEGRQQSWMGYGSEEYGQYFSVQLSEKDDTKHGDGYMGITITHPNVANVVNRVRASGVGKVISGPEEVTYPATQVPDQDPSHENKETRAVLQDPDGYTITVTEGKAQDPLSAVTVRVYDMEKAVEFYQKLGMKIMKKRANLPVETSMSTWMGYDDDFLYSLQLVHEKLKTPQAFSYKVSNVNVELKYMYDSKPVVHGTGSPAVVIGVTDVKAATDASAQGGAAIVQAPQMSSVGTPLSVISDMDGHTLALSDIEAFNKELM